MDYEQAKEKALAYGRKQGDEYDISAETKDEYFFGMMDVPTDNAPHGVYISKKTGRILPQAYEVEDPKIIGRPKRI